MTSTKFDMFDVWSLQFISMPPTFYIFPFTVSFFNAILMIYTFKTNIFFVSKILESVVCCV